MAIRKIARYGWKKDHLDPRDKILRAPSPAKVVLPLTADLRPGCPPIYDQGQLGSCTANGIAAAVDFERGIQKLPFMTPSRLFIYYNERVIEGDPDQDNGAEIRDGIKVVASDGVCPETLWPYSDQGTQFAVKPSPACYTDAVKFKALSYSVVTQAAYFTKHCLAILGRPFVLGFNVYDAFESDQVAATGIVPMPGPNDSPIGGHCVLCVGYDDSKSMYLLRNSWSDSWGLRGYFWMPYAYLLDPNQASDFWVILEDSPTTVVS